MGASWGLPGGTSLMVHPVHDLKKNLFTILHSNATNFENVLMQLDYILGSCYQKEWFVHQITYLPRLKELFSLKLKIKLI